MALTRKSNTDEDLAEYDFEFSVWPAEQMWEAAVYEMFLHFPRISIAASECLFREFRDSLERCGFTLREATRVPHHEPEHLSWASAR